MRVQVCPTYADAVDIPESALRRVLEQVGQLLRAVRECDRLVQLRTAADLDTLGDRIGIALALEGCEALGSDADAIDVFHELGARMASLTWNRRNAFADGCFEPAGGGLSTAGRALVERMAGLGMAIDLAHASEATFDQVLERRGDAPVLVSHGACRALHETPRNLRDGQLRALADAGGVLGVMLIPFAIGEPATLDRVVDHVLHATDVMGVAGVALGGDFTRQLARATGGGRPDPLLPPGELERAVEGLAGPQDYPALVDAFRGRGVDGADLDALLHGNLLRILRRALG